MAEKLKEQWIPDPVSETVLQKLGIGWRVETVRLDDIDWATTKRNCGRLGNPIDQDLIEDYGEAMKKGDSFPMPIVVENDKGDFIVLSGLHRTTGASGIGRKEMLAYVADITLPYQFRLVSIMSNRRQGKRVGPEEGINYALDLVLNHNLTVKNVVDLLGVRATSLNAKLRAKNLRDIAISAGSKLAYQANDSTSLAYVKYEASPRVLAEAMDHSIRHRLTQDECQSLSKEIAKEKNEAAQIQFIRAESLFQDKTRNNNGVVVLPIRAKLMKTLHTLKVLLRGKQSLEDCQIVGGSDDAKTVRRELREINSSMEQILKRKEANIPVGAGS
jgi:hypothetical protein